MYRCILAPVDGTPFGEQALAVAASIAQRAGAALHLAHVHVPLIAPVGLEAAAFPGAWSDIVKEQEREYLSGLADRLARRYEIRVRTRIMDGPVAGALEAYALDCAAGLVVMSTHGHAGLSRIWHHGVAGQVAHDLPLPVLLVRAATEPVEPTLEGPVTLDHVLVLLQGNGPEHPVLEPAVALGRYFQARYTLLRVVRARAAERELMMARQRLNALAERLRGVALEVGTEVRLSDRPAEVAAEVAASAGARLVAAQCTPARGVSRVFGNDVADAVVARTALPVLLLRADSAVPDQPARAAVAQARM